VNIKYMISISVQSPEVDAFVYHTTPFSMMRCLAKFGGIDSGNSTVVKVNLLPYWIFFLNFLYIQIQLQVFFVRTILLESRIFII